MAKKIKIEDAVPAPDIAPEIGKEVEVEVEVEKSAVSKVIKPVKSTEFVEVEFVGSSYLGCDEGNNYQSVNVVKNSKILVSRAFADRVKLDFPEDWR